MRVDLFSQLVKQTGPSFRKRRAMPRLIGDKPHARKDFHLQFFRLSGSLSPPQPYFVFLRNHARFWATGRFDFTNVAGTFHVPWHAADGTWNVPATLSQAEFSLPVALRGVCLFLDRRLEPKNGSYINERLLRQIGRKRDLALDFFPEFQRSWFNDHRQGMQQLAFFS